MKKKDTSSTSIKEVECWHQEACRILGFTSGEGVGRPRMPSSFAGRIELTLLKIDTTDDEVDILCREALEWGFRSVCCLPRDVVRCRRMLRGQNVIVVTVINFPLAGGARGVAELECNRVVENGAQELDMVVNVRSLRQGDLTAVRDEVGQVVLAAKGRPVKAILETGILTPRQVAWGAAAAEAGGASFVKTSTGFGPRGASLEDVALLRAVVGDRMGIKASGGIKNYSFGKKLIEAGADLLGTSSGSKCMPMK